MIKIIYGNETIFYWHHKMQWPLVGDEIEYDGFTYKVERRAWVGKDLLIYVNQM